MLPHNKFPLLSIYRQYKTKSILIIYNFIHPTNIENSSKKIFNDLGFISTRYKTKI